MADKFPHTTLQCLTAIAQHHGLQVNPERLIHDYALTAEEPSTGMLLQMAASIGLKAKTRQLGVDKLLGQKGVFPLLARMKDGNSVIVVGARIDDGGVFAVLDPLGDLGAVKMIDPRTFGALWTGEVLFLKRISASGDARRPFGLRWFIPEILLQKAAFRDIAIAAMAMNVLSLASPMFFQLVIDKVLVHHSVSTLWVLAVGILIAMIFESTFGFMRQILTLWGTNKIDIRLTRRTFAHLLSLPIDYFETTSAGVVVRHMQQMEKIRGFLTGRMFFTALDLTALVVLIPVLFSYSFKLTMIVLLFTLLISIIVAALVPAFQRRLNALYTAEGQRQALMVETIHGMRTVKALAIEPMQRRTWDQRSAHAMNMHFRVGQISITGNAVTDFLGKLLPVAIIVIGAQAVFDQTMSVGALIAFQMLSGRVSSPLIALVGLVNEYQETALSVRMLGEVMNRAPEGRAGGLRPELRGNISFDNVVFRYPGSQTNALDRATFEIKEGTVIGIVGPQRLGQDDDHEGHPRPVQHPGRPGALRRLRRARDRPAAFAAPDRRGLAGELPVPRHRARQHRRHHAGSTVRGRGGSRARRRRRRIHRAHAAGL